MINPHSNFLECEEKYNKLKSAFLWGRMMTSASIISYYYFYYLVRSFFVGASIVTTVRLLVILSFVKMVAITFRCFLFSILLSIAKTTLVRKTQQDGKIHELYASNISSNLLDWESDMAIMFYSPRCKYCKQLLPSLQAIATTVVNNHDLLIGQFNCENSIDQTDICTKFGVDRYPSIYFIGYGNYNQAPPNNPFGKTKYPNLVRYNADLYPEAIYDWILMLNKMSWFKRRWNEFLSIFNGNKERQKQYKKFITYKKQLDNLEKKVRLFSNELEKYKALELFDSLEDYGDVFPLLHSLEPDEVIINNQLLTTLPLPATLFIAKSSSSQLCSRYGSRVLQVSFLSFFLLKSYKLHVFVCRYFEKDEYCQSLSECSEQDLEPEV